MVRRPKTTGHGEHRTINGFPQKTSVDDNSESRKSAVTPSSRLPARARTRGDVFDSELRGVTGVLFILGSCAGNAAGQSGGGTV